MCVCLTAAYYLLLAIYAAIFIDLFLYFFCLAGDALNVPFFIKYICAHLPEDVSRDDFIFILKTDTL